MLYTKKTKGTQTEKELAGEFSKFVSINDVEVHYEFAKGKSKTLVVLLHGFGASTYSYRHLLKQFSKFGDVIAYDRPCFGLTVRPKTWTGDNPYTFPAQVKLLDGIVEHFGQGKQIILVGHSAGAGIAAEWALTNQDRVAALILEEPAILARPPAPKLLGSLLKSRAFDRLGPRLVAGFQKTGLGILYKSWFDKSGITEEVLENYQLPLKIKGWEAAFWEFSRNGVDSIIQDHLAELKIPTMVFAADNDEIILPKYSIAVAELIPNAHLVKLTDCGHIPHEEKPKEFMQAVTDLINQR